MTIYRRPPGVQPIELKKRQFLPVQNEGKVAIDLFLLKLWLQADGHNIDEILNNCQIGVFHPEGTKATLACITEAGLLDRNFPVQEIKALPTESNAHID